MIRATSQRTLDVITRALVGATAVLGAVCLVLAVRTILDVRTTRMLDADSHTLDTQIRNQAQSTSSTPSSGAQAPKGLAALRTLQTSVNQDAAKNECQVAEFRAGTQLTPYGPHYSKNGPDAPWSQVEAHFTVNGRLRDVMNTLRGLKDVGTPVEIDALNLARREVKPDGSTTITAQVDLRVLSQGGPV